MKAQDLKVNQRFSIPRAPGEEFTLAKPIERVGGVLMMKVKERPGDTMSLMPNDEVTLVK
jgi:hypothetical protein